MNGNIIDLTVIGYIVQGDGVPIGAAGSHDDVKLRITFEKDERDVGYGWTGTVKRIQWMDARGENSCVQLLGVDTREDKTDDSVHIVSIPAEAKAYAGNAQMSVFGTELMSDGSTEGQTIVTATARFRVLESVCAEPKNITADVVAQLQSEIDKTFSAWTDYATAEAETVEGEATAAVEYDPAANAGYGSVKFSFGIPRGEKGDAFTYNDFTPEQLEALKVKGADGYTPIKGTDYWTAEDAAEVDAAVAAANAAAANANEAADTAIGSANSLHNLGVAMGNATAAANAAANRANTASADLQAKADAGAFKGDKGEPGADGYTPVRGTDYWTDADKAAINADIAAQVAGKVDKIDGKGLSTNDYTDADKATVSGLQSRLTHIGDIEITESGIKIAVKDNLALRMAVVLITVPDGSPAINVEFRFDDNNTATRYCSNLNSGRVAVELKNGIPWLDYSFIKGADTSTQTVLAAPNSAFRSYTAYAATKITRIRIIGMNNAELLAGSKFEIYGVTV